LDVILLWLLLGLIAVGFAAAVIFFVSMYRLNRASVTLTTGFANIRNARSGPYHLLTTDRGKTIVLAGNAFYTLGAGPAAGFPINFIFTVVNEDADRGKAVDLSGLPRFILWPQQSVLVFNQANKWQVIGRSRWKAPNRTTDFYADIEHGSDDNDGLAPGAGNALQSVAAFMNDIVTDQLDFHGGLGEHGRVVIHMAPNSIDKRVIHWSSHGTIGAQGGAAITIDGGGTATLAGDESGTLQLYFGAVLSIQNVTLRKRRTMPA
jgi:hypothetical protein